MQGLLLSLAWAATLTACTFGHGPLEPIAGSGVTLVSTHGQPNGTVRLNVGGVTADVGGYWGELGESVEIPYRAGPVASRITMEAGIAWKGVVAPGAVMHDVTVPETSGTGRLLATGSALTLAPRARKRVGIDHDRTAGGDHPAIGDEIAVAIPGSGGARIVRFRVAGL